MAATQPLRSIVEVTAVRGGLKSARDHCLFSMGINTGFRSADFCALNVGDVRKLKVGDDLVLTEQKTGKVRRATINRTCFLVIRDLLEERPRVRIGEADHEPLFLASHIKAFLQEDPKRLKAADLSRLWTIWCKRAGLEGCYASHTGRKTFGYLNRTKRDISMHVLQSVYNHSDARITLKYLCIQDEEVRELYMGEF